MTSTAMSSVSGRRTVEGRVERRVQPSVPNRGWVAGCRRLVKFQAAELKGTMGACRGSGAYTLPRRRRLSRRRLVLPSMDWQTGVRHAQL